jgi:hypothetical protein
VRRFADIAPNRFWFVLKNQPEIKGFVRLQVPPFVVAPGRVTARALRAAPQVVGGIGGATIFAAPTRNGYLQMFSVDKHGRVGGRPSHVSEPHAIGVVQVGRGSLFSSRAYLVVAGSTLEQRGTKLFLVYADGSRERIKPILAGKPVGAGFYYYVIPKAHRIRVGRATALELVRGSRLVARQPLPMPYQGPEQPGELQVRVAQQVFGHVVPAKLG